MEIHNWERDLFNKNLKKKISLNILLLRFKCTLKRSKKLTKKLSLKMKCRNL